MFIKSYYFVQPSVTIYPVRVVTDTALPVVFLKQFYTTIAFTKSWVYALQLIIVDAYYKPLHISKADTKILIGGFQAMMRVAGFIPFLG